MAPKYNPTPLSGGDRKALAKETDQGAGHDADLAERANEKHAAGEALIQEADDLACQSWNERMWAGGGPIDPSQPSIRAINGGLRLARNRLLKLQDAAQRSTSARCACTVDLRPRLAGRVKCRSGGSDRRHTLHQLAQRKRHIRRRSMTRRGAGKSYVATIQCNDAAVAAAKFL